MYCTEIYPLLLSAIAKTGHSDFLIILYRIITCLKTSGIGEQVILVSPLSASTNLQSHEIPNCSTLIFTWAKGMCLHAEFALLHLVFLVELTTICIFISWQSLQQSYIPGRAYRNLHFFEMPKVLQPHYQAMKIVISPFWEHKHKRFCISFLVMSLP